MGVAVAHEGIDYSSHGELAGAAPTDTPTQDIIATTRERFVTADMWDVGSNGSHLYIRSSTLDAQQLADEFSVVYIRILQSHGKQDPSVTALMHDLEMDPWFITQNTHTQAQLQKLLRYIHFAAHSPLGDI